MPLWKSLCFFALSVASLFVQPDPAGAYPIDCAILLCLAGGFPPSVPCAAARIEMIRRITPWPIEPPLQIWRCPMHASFVPERLTSEPAPILVAFPGQRHLPGMPMDETDLAPIYDSTIESYLAAIKVYNLTYTRHRGQDDDCNISSSLQVGSYDAAGGFVWRQADVRSAPAWMFNASYSQCIEAWFRGVGMEWRDYEGGLGTEVIRY